MPPAAQKTVTPARTSPRPAALDGADDPDGADDLDGADGSDGGIVTAGDRHACP